MEHARELAAENDRSAADGRPRLMDEIRRGLGLKHYGLRTEQAYLCWIRRYIRDNG
ncbi:MAG: hypothetical protein AMXMBFR59_42490 [Rhodanobacteraceae bacterium]